MEYKFKEKLASALPAVLALSLIVPMASFAGFFSHHHYARALCDLRHARAMLKHSDRANVAIAQQNAVRELNLAIDEIKGVTGADWKPSEERAIFDNQTDKSSRFQQAMKVLARAHNDICKEEDDAGPSGLRNRAVGHLDQAMSYVRQAMVEKSRTEFSQPEKGAKTARS